jgi:hypothetical protein
MTNDDDKEAQAQTYEIEERAFWEAVSQLSLAKIWENEADDIYAELLEE